MRILNWVQNKFGGKQENKRFDAVSGSARHSYTPDSRKEEFSDWPEGLLAIGTFGNKEPKEEPKRDPPSCSSRDLPDFTIEEVSKLQKELTKFLALKPKSSTDGSEMAGGDRANHPLNRFLNCPSSLEVDRRARLKLPDDASSNDNNNNGDLSPDTKIILNKARDILADNRNAMKQRSLSFLLKKMFVCASGFTPSPSLRDPNPESRMEKILRTMLQKKLYSQNSTSASTKKFLEDKHKPKPNEKKRMGDKTEKVEDGQWVKTDSEYIVLEI